MFGLQMMHEMDSLQREMEQVLCGLGFNPLSAEIQPVKRFKVREKETAFEVEATVPGLDIDKLDISILGRRLTVAGEFVSTEAPEGATWHRHERQAGRFEKSLQLTANVDSEQVEAEYQQGILRIILPKAASALPRKINVKAA